jgi:hypothetical protein
MGSGDSRATRTCSPWWSDARARMKEGAILLDGAEGPGYFSPDDGGCVSAPETRPPS